MKAQPSKERRRNRFHPEPGCVYRTADLRQWTENPTRLAKRLVAQGRLKPLAHGLYAVPRQTRFGVVPPKAEAILDAFLGHTPFVLTGPEYWNALGLGSTALFPKQLVYNTKRSGEFELGGRRFLLRRVAFPARVTREWYAVDLAEHRDTVGLATEVLISRMRNAVTQGGLDQDRLRETAREYGTRNTQRLIEQALEPVSEAV
jgi:hypothetical protein